MTLGGRFVLRINTHYHNYCDRCSLTAAWISDISYVAQKMPPNQRPNRYRNPHCYLLILVGLLKEAQSCCLIMGK
jgi:hypothetical protein